MPRYRQSAEEELRVDLDSGFLGVNDRLDPSLLRQGASWADVREEAMAPGLVAEARNVRFGRGMAETRPGVLEPVHFNSPSFTALRGAGLFSDPRGREWLVVADAAATWLLCDGVTPQRVNLPGGVVLNERVSFCQAFGTLLMFRGADRETLCWEGNRRKPWTIPAQAAPNPDAPSFLDPVPAAAWGVCHADRVWVPISRDELAWSDLLDYTNFDLTLNTVRINAGHDDKLVGAVAFRGSRLVVFKDQSFYGLSGLEGADLTQTLAVEPLSLEIGCLARDTICNVGGDLLWLAQGHVYRMSEALQDSLQASAIPVSLAIESTMARINWSAAHLAQAVVVDQYYHLAVPLDGSERNNAVLIYDTTTRMWQGVDAFDWELAAPPPAEPELLPPDPPLEMAFNGHPFVFNGRPCVWPAPRRWSEVEWDPWIWSNGPGGPMAPVSAGGDPLLVRLEATRLVKTDLWGRKAAFAMQDTRLLALGRGHADYVAGRWLPIQTRLQTRGYVFGQLGIKQVRELLLAVETWDAELTVTLLLDGVAEEKVVLHRKTRDKTKRTRHGLPRWVRSNENNDHGMPHREDYSVIPADGTQPRGGFVPFTPQHWLISFPVRANARWAAVRLESRRGFVRLKSVQCEARAERHFHKLQA